MRISDWSSDVCSSDLLGERRPRIVEATELGQHRAELAVEARHTRIDLDGHAVAALRLVERAERREDVAELLKRVRVRRVEVDRAHQDLRGLLRLAALVRQDAGPHQHAVIVGRSEEHTSELQSLMRISYAVV